LEDLESQGRVPEVIMLGWSIVEFSLDSAILKEYNLPTRDPKTKPLLDLRIGDKLRLQRQLGYLSEKEVNVIQEFKNERDSLFHLGGLSFPNFSDFDKNRLVDLAIRSADVAHALLDRILNSTSGYPQSMKAEKSADPK
jgi:hypothetical protein